MGSLGPSCELSNPGRRSQRLATAADDASSHVPPEKNLDLSNFFLSLTTTTKQTTVPRHPPRVLHAAFPRARAPRRRQARAELRPVRESCVFFPFSSVRFFLFPLLFDLTLKKKNSKHTFFSTADTASSAPTAAGSPRCSSAWATGRSRSPSTSVRREGRRERKSRRRNEKTVRALLELDLIPTPFSFSRSIPPPNTPPPNQK